MQSIDYLYAQDSFQCVFGFPNSIIVRRFSEGQEHSVIRLATPIVSPYSFKIWGPSMPSTIQITILCGLFTRKNPWS
jgi:hypothetical protein